MVGIGIAGIGFMGVTHYKALDQVADARVTAVFTRSEKKLAGDWSDVQGNFGGAGGEHDLSNLARHRRFEDLIADQNVDLVDICLPSPMHADATIAALEAGKHVLVEKPIALTVEDADRMIATAATCERQLMVGQVLRFWPEWKFLKDAMTSSEYGRLMTLNLRRIISRPDWSKDIANFSANGGPLIDLHIHDVDFVLYLLGKPKQLRCIGRLRDDCVVYVSTLYDYEGGPTVSAQSGAVAMPGRPFRHEYEACFEKATVTFAAATEPEGVDASAGQSSSQVLTVYDGEGHVSFPQVSKRDGFVAQLEHAAQCAAADRPSPIIDGTHARDSLAVVHLEGESLCRGATLDVT